MTTNGESGSVQPEASGRRFRAKQSFFSDETRSQYVEGLYYTSNDELELLVDRWVSEGKVELSGAQATVSGG